MPIRPVAAGAGAAAQPVASKKGVKKFENGFEIHSTKMGDPHGKLAKAGKKVSVKYTGRLMNGKVFDKTGNKPFTFRLGEAAKSLLLCSGQADQTGRKEGRLLVAPHFGAFQDLRVGLRRRAVGLPAVYCVHHGQR